MKIYSVPEIFQIPDILYYPEDNWPDFEYWFMKNISEDELIFDRIYLPILFTAYFKRNQYGKNQASIDQLQRFIDTLPVDQKYFAVVQYDDGTLIDWKGKDVKVFAMSGKPEGCIPIPLVCQPHKFKFDEYGKDILFSFVGRITDRTRVALVDWGKYKTGVYISTEKHTLYEYCKILARSKYVFCPRGYGASSFRVGEALQYGAVPIQFVDVNAKVDSNVTGIVHSYESNFTEHDIEQLYQWIMHSGPASIDTEGHKQEYKTRYSFEGVKQLILSGLWDLQ